MFGAALADLIARVAFADDVDASPAAYDLAIWVPELEGSD